MPPSLTFFLFSLFISLASMEKTIEIEITDIRSSEGSIRIEVFRSPEAFMSETESLSFEVPKSSISDGILKTSITLPYGTHGIAILDDENMNQEMDYSWGLPTEGFGFSNYYHTGWSYPKFDSFKFAVTDQDPGLIQIKVRYIR